MPDNNKSQAILDEVFAEKLEEKPVYGRIPADLHAELLEIKATKNKSISELVEAGLRLLVAAYKEKKDKVA